MNDLPSEICELCKADAPDHWLTDFWYYCGHNRVMVRRRRREDEWTIDRGVKPRRAAKHLAAALDKMRAYTKSQGIDMDVADKLMTRLRQMNQK